jgi:hypothetical protein
MLLGGVVVLRREALFETEVADVADNSSFA